MRQVRLATAADIDAVIGVAPAGDERRAALAAHAHAGECHVLWDGAEAAGYVVLTRDFFHSAFIELLVTAPRHRRTGVASALVRHCIGLVPTGEKLWTSTNRSNAPMHALLLPLGFVEAGVIEGLDEGDPEVIYRRD